MDEEQNAKFAIHAACREGQTLKVESLLAADPRLSTLRDPDDRLPLHWAASYNRLPILDLLSDLKSFDPDVQDGAGWTALMMSSSLRDGDSAVDLLLSKSADPSIKTHLGQTALHFACSKSNLDTVRKLLAHGASARVKDKRGQLPLHRAAAVGNVAVCKVLLGEGRSPLDATDVDGCAAIHHAVAEGHGEVAVELLRRGARSDGRDGNGKLMIELAPDERVRGYVLRRAEEEGLEVVRG
ncbi:unnamed protein product [Zymoseptoria tritici ST99CH_1A5]|uniref:Uncharacterized protein n=1 Tax=Zymoseptoria tritici ST99CH_1A5 TaxID=1276529 RepID=A0A1Y6LAL7_ZYMTR|nr:unnamed protein product [Zymoseptoria tritici ST99CH_1A5]